jgi:hypothetical protein
VSASDESLSSLLFRRLGVEDEARAVRDCWPEIVDAVRKRPRWLAKTIVRALLEKTEEKK